MKEDSGSLPDQLNDLCGAEKEPLPPGAQWRDHPQYEDGYFDAIHRPATGQRHGSEPYIAGWEAAMDARAILSGEGFTETKPGRFSKTTEVGRTTHIARRPASAPGVPD